MGKRLARDLLLTLEDETQVDRRLPRSKQVLDRLHRDHVVALVVCASTRVEDAVADVGFEWRRCPLVQRVGRLHVVVAVNREVGLAGPAVPVRDDDRQPALQNLDDLGLHPHAGEAVAQPLRVAEAVGTMLGQRADRRDPELFEQVGEVGLARGGRSRERGLLQDLGGRHSYFMPRERLICSAWS